MVLLANQAQMEVLDLHLKIVESSKRFHQLSEILHGNTGFLQCNGKVAKEILSKESRPDNARRNFFAGTEKLTTSWAKHQLSMCKLLSEAGKRTKDDSEIIAQSSALNSLSRVYSLLDVAVERILDSKDSASSWAINYERLSPLLMEWEPGPALEAESSRNPTKLG